VISALIAVATFIALASLGAMIGAEFLGWLPALARVLVDLSVRQLPADKRERYREEFLYDIQSKASDRKVMALIWALRTCISARGLAKNLKEPDPRTQQARTSDQQDLEKAGSPAQRITRRRPNQDLAAVLKQLRTDRNMTQEELAYDAGLTVSTVSRIERGLNDPTWTTVRRLTKALGVSIEEVADKVDDFYRSRSA
jgi:DNA-binding XRE family transcriptional regulator